MKKINIFCWLLCPFAWLYGVVGWIRNKLYDWKVLKTTAFEGVRLIGVGNLNSGGTGKTPHVEYLVNLYKRTHKVATLSRGYKRKTKGFVLADAQTTALEIGDEPMQLYRKFAKDGVVVAVGENRVEAVRNLLQLRPDIEVIVLDDVFQHRRIAVDVNILLTDFHHLFMEDYVLPMGSLREFRRGYERADVVVVTKCPNDCEQSEQVLSEERKREIVVGICPLGHQRVLFSYLKYGVPYSFLGTSPLSPSKGEFLDWEGVDAVLVVCGIAKPERLLEYVKSQMFPQIHSWVTDGEKQMDALVFGDHHDFSVGDLERISGRFEGLEGKNRVVITTEKDVVRLELWRDWLEKKGIWGRIFVLGIEVGFWNDDIGTF